MKFYLHFLDSSESGGESDKADKIDQSATSKGAPSARLLVIPHPGTPDALDSVWFTVTEDVEILKLKRFMLETRVLNNSSKITVRFPKAQTKSIPSTVVLRRVL